MVEATIEYTERGETTTTEVEDFHTIRVKEGHLEVWYSDPDAIDDSRWNAYNEGRVTEIVA